MLSQSPLAGQSWPKPVLVSFFLYGLVGCGGLTDGLVADGVGVEVGAESLEVADELESAGVDGGTLLNLGGEGEGAGGEEGDDGRGKLHFGD